ncbi:hypothetical protein HDU92_007391 [Lobulomyces angularis]|nr:hypothetical protein HDU92_007391 [Lobulomyces angularis]
MSSLYWFISAPGSPTKKDTLNKVKEKLESSSSDLGEVLPINLPDFKVGTLDTLYVLSDELQKHDASVESIALKIAENFKGLLQNNIDAWKNSLTVGDKSVDQFLKTFQWNTMKYRVDKSLKDLTDVILQEVNSIDALMKNKIQAYTQMKGQLQSLQRKQTGNLAVRSLNDVVKREYFVLDSEYLTTILVAVPKSLVDDWKAKYESLTQMVVPRSSQRIAEDEEYALYTVTLFQRVVEEFTIKARENKFIVRDYKWNEEQMQKEKKELSEAGASEKEQSATLQRLCKTNFGEIFSCWIHLKAIRVFVESILRHGLPPNSQAMMIKVKPKHARKARDALNALFAYLDVGGNAKDKGYEGMEESLTMLIGDKDYAPFVLFKIDTPY